MKKKRIHPVTIGLFFAIFIGMLMSSQVSASSEDKTVTKLRVGASHWPPFTMKAAHSGWEGIGIDLWRAVAKELNADYEIVDFTRTKQIVAALHSGDIDVAPVVPLSANNEITIDLSHAMYQSGLGMAVSADSYQETALSYAARIVSMNILKILGVLLLLSLACGTIVWLFEKHENNEMFDKRPSIGIGQGLWWALVTMTTVGYGDKAPRTIGGRVVAVLWIFISVILIINYTAVVTSSLTVRELSGRIKSSRDLPDVRVGALMQSETSDSLSSSGIPVIPFKNVTAGLQAVTNNDIDVFVDDEAQLKYLAKTSYPGKIHVLPETFANYYFCMGIPEGSSLREPLNRALVKIMKTDDWAIMKKRYMGTH